jgi:hypothetical protein
VATPRNRARRSSRWRALTSATTGFWGMARSGCCTRNGATGSFQGSRAPRRQLRGLPHLRSPTRSGCLLQMDGPGAGWRGDCEFWWTPGSFKSRRHREEHARRGEGRAVRPLGLAIWCASRRTTGARSWWTAGCVQGGAAIRRSGPATFAPPTSGRQHGALTGPLSSAASSRLSRRTGCTVPAGLRGTLFPGLRPGRPQRLVVSSTLGRPAADPGHVLAHHGQRSPPSMDRNSCHPDPRQRRWWDRAPGRRRPHPGPGNHTDAVPVQLAGRSYYEELLGAGVRIFEFQPR